MHDFVTLKLNFLSFFAIEDEWKYNKYKQRQMILEVMDTNLDSRTDSLTRRRLEFQNLNNNGDNLLIKKETKLEDIILASTHGENIIYEIHSRISSEVIPKVGMNFSNEKYAYEFYKTYAKEVGFGIRMSVSHDDNEGKRPSDKRYVIIKTHPSETRSGCKTTMKINCRVTGRYQLVQVIHEHNHTFCSPKSEETYDMAKYGMQKMLETVKARLKNKQVKIVSVDTVGPIKIDTHSSINSVEQGPSQMLQEGAFSTYDLNGRNIMSDHFVLQPSISMHSTPFFQFLNQASYQQNHMPVSSRSMIQVIQADKVPVVDESQNAQIKSPSANVELL
ncbi:hypothetical protein M9H77_17380 [Catharanthus roseus]|uniref:Uncharacterized protein n=1 Tax=Catharanthus roseus TaxID=4058 RepID=A0ACC0B4G2_CATRO|nr:hypothetical protein M9H77_17380 [Catharanthus roseus]